MSLYEPPNSNPKRRPSLRGAVMLDVTHGAPRARAWPSPRGKGGTPAQKAQRDWFRQASWAMKYMAPEMVKDVMEARAGLPLLPRDMLMMMLSGRLMQIITPTGRRLIPLVAQNDVSESLDMISAVPGSILVRGTTAWESIPAPTPGQLWWWQPPDPTSWLAVTSDSIDLYAEYDALKGCAIDGGQAISGDRNRLLLQTIQFPAATWRLNAQFSSFCLRGDFAWYGIAIYDQSSGRFLVFGREADFDFRLNYWSSLTSYSTTYFEANVQAPCSENGHFRVESDGTTLKFFIGPDGENWQQVATRPLNDPLSGTPSHIGIVAGYNRNYGPSIMNFGRWDWFN